MRRAAIKGSVFDVEVDLIKDSDTYDRWYGIELTEENKKQFLPPKGFAHGFLVLSDKAEFCYKCDDFYYPNDEGGIAWNDPEIGIVWPYLTGEYNGTASAEGYVLDDGTELKLSGKDPQWAVVVRLKMARHHDLRGKHDIFVEVVQWRVGTRSFYRKDLSRRVCDGIRRRLSIF